MSWTTRPTGTAQACSTWGVLVAPQRCSACPASCHLLLGGGLPPPPVLHVITGFAFATRTDALPPSLTHPQIDSHSSPLAHINSHSSTPPSPSPLTSPDPPPSPASTPQVFDDFLRKRAAKLGTNIVNGLFVGLDVNGQDSITVRYNEYSEGATGAGGGQGWGPGRWGGGRWVGGAGGRAGGAGAPRGGQGAGGPVGRGGHLWMSAIHPSTGGGEGGMGCDPRGEDSITQHSVYAASELGCTCCPQAAAGTRPTAAALHTRPARSSTLSAGRDAAGGAGGASKSPVQGPP